MISDIELMPSARPKSVIPIGNPMAMNEPNATSRMITAMITPITSPVPVSASSNAKNRSPPISTCSDEPSRSSTPSSLRFARSLASRSSITGYCTRISAMRPSGDTEPLAAASPGPAAISSAGSLVPTTLSRAATCACTSARSSRASSESKKVTPSSTGVATTWAVNPARSDSVRDSRSVASCESRPGTSKESSSSRPSDPAAVTTSSETSSQAPMTTQGRRAANRPKR